MQFPDTKRIEWSVWLCHWCYDQEKRRWWRGVQESFLNWLSAYLIQSVNLKLIWYFFHFLHYIFAKFIIYLSHSSFSFLHFSFNFIFFVIYRTQLTWSSFCTSIPPTSTISSFLAYLSKSTKMISNTIQANKRTNLSSSKGPMLLKIPSRQF